MSKQSTLPQGDKISSPSVERKNITSTESRRETISSLPKEGKEQKKARLAGEESKMSSPAQAENLNTTKNISSPSQDFDQKNEEEDYLWLKDYENTKEATFSERKKIVSKNFGGTALPNFEDLEKTRRESFLEIKDPLEKNKVEIDLKEKGKVTKSDSAVDEKSNSQDYFDDALNDSDYHKITKIGEIKNAAQEQSSLKTHQQQQRPRAQTQPPRPPVQQQSFRWSLPNQQPSLSPKGMYFSPQSQSLQGRLSRPLLPPNLQQQGQQPQPRPPSPLPPEVNRQQNSSLPPEQRPKTPPPKN
jgi:hypothetical protein